LKKTAIGMPSTHVIQQGETLTLIAARSGFRDWRTIYLDPLNAPFRAKRPDPDMIFPGDVLIIPDRTSRSEEAVTGKRHRYIVRKTRLFLRVVLVNFDGKPFSNKRYVLRVDGQPIGPVRARTNGDGLLEQEVPFGARAAQIRIAGCTWELDLAHLNPMDDVNDGGISGAQARLANLGYESGPVDGVESAMTARALAQFQADASLSAPREQQGLDDSTKAALVSRHRC
jgi:N-acetylmuramoyl-L-alanine amidase